jgi:hypothetical protein
VAPVLDGITSSPVGLASIGKKMLPAGVVV